MKSLIIFTFILLLLIPACTTYTSKYSDPTKWEYFNVYVKTEDDPIFLQLQDDLFISPYMESYLITVDLRNKKDRYLILGGEGNEGAKRFAWEKLSQKVREGLIKWKGLNKEKL